MQVADRATQLKKLQMENAQLRQQLEKQYEAMIEMADTIAQSHLPRIAESAVDAASDGTYQREGKHKESENVASAFIVRCCQLSCRHTSINVPHAPHCCRGSSTLHGTSLQCMQCHQMSQQTLTGQCRRTMRPPSATWTASTKLQCATAAVPQ